jgi:outer membrane receptor protein involved in Fe transport
MEYSYIRVLGVNQYLEDFDRIINDLDFMPALSLVYSLTDKANLRLAASQTVSRPQFRELNPALFPTSPGERAFQGNETLVPSTIQSVDLRWEWFLSPLELLSAGVFFKNIEDPIEQNVASRTTLIVETTANAGSATVYGFELEARKNFEFAYRYLRNWKTLRPFVRPLPDVELVANVTWVESEAKGFRPLREGAPLNVASRRALTDQAPFVINASLQYDNPRWGLFRLLYNTVGPTIVSAGNTGGGQQLPNILQERRDQLDFVWLRQWQVMGNTLKSKLSVENITNDDFVETQGELNSQEVVTNHYYTGVTFSVGLTYDF